MLSADVSHAELIQACLNSDGDAWREFIRRYTPVISLAVSRTASRWRNRSQSVVEELIQDTYLKLCDKQFKILREFEFQSEDSIYCFLKSVATNITHDYFRSIFNKKRAAHLTVDLDEIYDTSRHDMPGNPDSVQQAVLIKEVESVLDELAGPDAQRDRDIFWFYYRYGFTAMEIAEMPGIGLSAKGVESALQRLAKSVKKNLTENFCGCDLTVLAIKGTSE